MLICGIFEEAPETLAVDFEASYPSAEARLFSLFSERIRYLLS